MRISFNIEKRHLFVFGLFLVLFFSGYVIATGFTSNQASHPTLFADIIRGKSSGTVTVNDNLKVSGNLEVTGTCTGCGIEEQTTEQTIISNPKKGNHAIKYDRESAEKYCELETEYPRYIRSNGIACVREETFYYWNPLENEFIRGSCLGQVQKITSITCERDRQEEIKPHGSYELEADWEIKCSEGKTMIGLKRVYNPNREMFVNNIICK